MKLEIYLNYAGNCEEAFRFYEKHLGAKITLLTKHGEGPAKAPPGLEGKVLHARMELGGTAVRGADIPQAQPMRSAYVTLLADSDKQANDLYALLTEGGEVFMKMETTFFASRFAMFRDRFGTSWMLLKEKS